MTDTIEIEVTRDDILGGRAGDSFRCPITIAAKRTTGFPCSTNTFWISFYGGNRIARYLLSPEGIKFVRDFDDLKLVEPITIIATVEPN